MVKKILILCLAAAAAGGAAAQEAVSMTYDANLSDTPAAKMPGTCGVTVTGIADRRNNTETVGSEFKPLLSRDPVPWVRAAFGGLGAWGYAVDSAPAAKPGEVAIDAALIRAYTFHGPMRINGVVALDAHVTTPSGKRIDRKYRAFGSKTNMMGATSEYMDALNYAINDLLGKLAADLKEFCAAK
jgi:uncharacterized lipoprotein YajG